MARNNGIYLTLAFACLLVFCNSALAQTDSTTTTVAGSSSSSTAAPGPVSCENATPFTANGTKLLGTWYEAARKPIGGGANAEQCVQLIITLADDKVNAQVTYSLDPSALWINQTVNASVQVGTSATTTSEIFSAVFYVVTGGVNTTLKILDTDYTSYMFVCGYTTVVDSTSTTTAASTTVSSSSSSSSSSTSTVSSSSTTAASTTAAPVSTSTAGAFIMTRIRSINATVLATLTSTALVNYSDFKNISTVTQTEECYKSGAATTVPLLAMIMAVVYSILKLVH